jgi:ubiquinone/menaquinone biosynthesis C-methylase UbiE
MDHGAAKFIRAYQDPFWREVLRREADYIRGALAGCEKVLDAGCGVGALDGLLSEFEIIGLDNDLAMLREARAARGMDCVLGDAAHLGFRDEAFDAVFFLTSLEFMADYRPALTEAARVLTDEGRLVAMMLNPRSWRFKERLKRADSYLKNIRVKEPSRVKEYAAGFFNVEAEYFLGIKGDRLFDSCHDELAALYVIKGRKLQ